MSLTEILLMAFICEAIWQTLKMTFQKDKYATIDRIGALILGVLLAISCNLDVLSLLKVNSKIPYLGVILTGVLISRGSNFIHDFIQIVTNFQKGDK